MISKLLEESVSKENEGELIKASGKINNHGEESVTFIWEDGDLESDTSIKLVCTVHSSTVKNNLTS